MSRSLCWTFALLLGFPVAMSVSGCASMNSAMRSAVRNEHAGPDGLLVRGGGPSFYIPSALFPPGVKTFNIGSIPKSYEVLLDLTEDVSIGRSAGGGKDLTVWRGTTVKATPNSTQVTQHQSAIANNPYAMYGAAVAGRQLREGNTFERHPLLQRVPSGGQAILSFEHELVSIGEPSEDVSLEPFGKILSVTTQDGEVRSETREPVYTITVPSRHRLVAVVTDPAGKELKRVTYCTWSKDAKYYQDKHKHFFADENAARASFTAEQEAFNGSLRTGPLFASKKPKNMKEAGVVDLTVISDEDVFGAKVVSDFALWMALPSNSTDRAEMTAILSRWFKVGDLGCSLNDAFADDPSWIPVCIAEMVKIRDTVGADKTTRVAATLNIATCEASRLDALAAVAAVKTAQTINPSALGQDGWLTKGGVLDYGSNYYIARDAWLNLGTTVQAVSSWREKGVTRASIPSK